MDTRRKVNHVLAELDSWDPKRSEGLTKTDVIAQYLRVDEIQDFHTYIKRNTRPREFRRSKRKTDEFKMLPLFLFETACRIKEALNLKVAHIDFEENKIMVHDGKGGKARPVNINDSAPLVKQHIEEYDITGDLFAIDRDSTEYDLLTDKFKQVGEKLFGRKVTSHWFRHSFATNWAILRFEEGLPKGEVKDQIREYLGHNDQQTTEAYIHAAEDLRRDNIYEDGEFELEI
jgi:integrase